MIRSYDLAYYQRRYLYGHHPTDGLRLLTLEKYYFRPQFLTGDRLLLAPDVVCPCGQIFARNIIGTKPFALRHSALEWLTRCPTARLIKTDLLYVLPE